jgi:hypothetical protein
MADDQNPFQDPRAEADIMRLIRQSYGPGQRHEPPFQHTPDRVPGGDQLMVPGPYDAVNPLHERMGRAALDYGPLPAKMATGIVTQPYHAGVAVGEAANDPSISNLTNAGVQVAGTFARPLAVAGIGGAGLLAAGAKDLGLSSDNFNPLSSAIAQTAPKVDPALLDRNSARAADPMWRAVKDDPALASKYVQLEAARQRSTDKMKGVNAEGSNSAREKATAEAERLSGEITGELAKRNPPKLSFEQAYPETSKMIPIAQTAAGFAGGFLAKGAANKLSKNGPWAEAVKDGNRALSKEGGPDFEAASRAAVLAKAYKDDTSSMGAHFSKVFGGYGAPMIVGGEVGAAPEMMRQRYNLANAPEGSPEHRRAVEAAGDGTRMLSTMQSNLVPGAIGGLGAASLRRGKPEMGPETRALEENLKAAKQPPFIRTGPGAIEPPPMPPGASSYPKPGTHDRTVIRDTVRNTAGDDYVNRDLVRQTIDRQLPGHTISEGAITRKMNATDKAMQEFAARNGGRGPQTEADWATIFKSASTLGVVGGAGLASQQSPFQFANE